MSLTLEEAQRIIAGVIAKAKDLNVKVCVAVCDAGGRLIAFQRMDGAFLAGVFGSQGKAMASAAFARPSAMLQERADSPLFRGINAAEGNHMIMSQGGVPIFRDGVIIGACGVGGASSQQDEDLAIAGVALL